MSIIRGFSGIEIRSTGPTRSKVLWVSPADKVAQGGLRELRGQWVHRPALPSDPTNLFLAEPRRPLPLRPRKAYPRPQQEVAESADPAASPCPDDPADHRRSLAKDWALKRDWRRPGVRQPSNSELRSKDRKPHQANRKVPLL